MQDAAGVGSALLPLLWKSEVRTLPADLPSAGIDLATALAQRSELRPDKFMSNPSLDPAVMLIN